MIITPILISKNAQHTIAQTLNSLRMFDEVVVLDTGSSDNTMKIARQFPNVKLFQSAFSGFGKSKNEAAHLANTDWVLSIDTDEVLTPELIDSIKKLKLKEGTVYEIKRFNFYKDREIRYSGWGHDFVVRLYNRRNASFKEKLVHEYVESTGLKVETLKGNLNHYSYHSISDFSRKRELYSDLFALENMGKRKSSSITAFLHGSFDFINTYILKRGFLDGYVGLLISMSNANVTFLKYIKLYEANLELKLYYEKSKPIPVYEPMSSLNTDTSQPQFVLRIAHQITENELNEAVPVKRSLLYLHNKN